VPGFPLKAGMTVAGIIIVLLLVDDNILSERNEWYRNLDKYVAVIVE